MIFRAVCPSFGLILTVAGTFLGSSLLVDRSAAAGTLTISTGVWVGYGALYLARDLGFFKARGLDVDLVQESDNLAIGASLVAGSISGAAAEVDIMLPIRKNVCVKGVITLDDSSGADGILAVSEVKGLADLKGQTIAVTEPGQPNVFFNAVLRAAGLKRNDVTVLNMRPDDAAAAFMAGRVPAAVTYEPSLTFAAQAHAGRVLYDSSKTPGLIADLVFLNCSVISAQPKDVAALVEGLFEADDYIKVKPQSAYAIMMKYVGGYLSSPEDFAKAAQYVKYYDRAMNVTYLGGKDHPGKITETMGFIYDIWDENLPHFSYGELIDPQFLH